MEIDLPPEVLSGLPAPDSQGIVRVMVGMKVSPQGDCDLVEVNDMPVEVGDDDQQGNDDSEDGEVQPGADDDSTPDLGAMADQIYGRTPDSPAQ